MKVANEQIPLKVLIVKGSNVLQMATVQEGPGSAHDLLRGLDGATLSTDEVQHAISLLNGNQSLHVSSVSLQDGTVNIFSTSSSAMLRVHLTDGTETPLFLKKVTASAMAHKPWVDRQRTLKYIRTELRFYDEFAPMLRARGVSLPRPALVQGQLQALGDTEVAAPPIEEPTEHALSQCGAILFLEPVLGFTQTSPLAAEQAVVALAAVARLHAAAWEDTELLQGAAERLQRHGGASALSIRNPKELQSLQSNWADFVSTFTPHAPELFSRSAIARLGDRLVQWSQWISDQLSPGPGDACATLVHGDFKAMNVFLPPKAAADGHAVLIDFASVGVGFGLADVAMHLTHAVLAEELADGGEERLVDAYLAALADARGPDATPYPKDLAMHHYMLGVVDYGRFVIGRSWVQATPESFAAKASNTNIGLWNQRVDCALAFVERIDRCLQHFEAQLLQQAGQDAFDDSSTTCH